MENLEEKVIEAIKLIRPSLQNDGGDIEFVKMEGNKVYVKLQGACAGCMMAEMTLKNGIERMLRYNVDDNIEVIDLTFEEEK
ncbi:MAG: NifU family protein [Sphaerochaeta sp.]